MDKEEEIYLNTPWSIWYHHSLDDWSIGGYRNIHTIKTVNDFWRFFNNIECIGGINNLHFFMMREGITPRYEDKGNMYGGSWSMLVPMQKAYDLWETICVGLIGETLIQDSLSVTGVSINVKNGISVIKIWNNNKQKNDIRQLPQFKNLSSEIIYRQHKVEF